MTTRQGFEHLLADAAHAAQRAYRHAMGTMTEAERRRTVGEGADGTETFLLDIVVEESVLEVLERYRVNVLSEEVGWIDRGSAVTVVIDPVDGTANAAAGVPVCAFAGAVVVDGVIEAARIEWFDTARQWSVSGPQDHAQRVSGRCELQGASVSLLRPRPSTMAAWSSLAGAAGRVRVLGSSVLEAALVADGAIDLFCDPGGDVHRIVDIAAAKLIVEASGGVAVDMHGRPFTFEPDLQLRWSGVFAATPELADEVLRCVHGSGDDGSDRLGAGYRRPT